jgi:hypothetical protein
VQFHPAPDEAKGVAAHFVDMKTVELDKEWLRALWEEWS